jgi:hypothetical protein
MGAHQLEAAWKYDFILRDLPRDSNTRYDEKSDTFEGLTLLTTPRQRGRLTPCQRFLLILHLTSTSSSPRECCSVTPPSLPHRLRYHRTRIANDSFVGSHVF